VRQIAQIVTSAVLAALLLTGVGVDRGRAAEGDGHLVVADIAAERLYVYSVPTLDLIAELSGLKVSEHAGFLPLPDGRLLFVDELRGDLATLLVGPGRQPEIVGRVPVPTPVSHFAVNPTITHAVVGSQDKERPLTVIDIADGTARSFKVATGEPGVLLGGDLLVLVHRNDKPAQFEAYPLARIVDGNHQPTSVVDIGKAGHGEAISHGLGRVYSATDDGVDALDLVGESLKFRATLPWAASARTGGRAYFVRLSNDGNYLYSYLRISGGSDTPWQNWQNDAYIADLRSDEVTRVPLGPGLVYRQAQSDRYVLYFNIHPDGDHAYLLDADPASSGFRGIVATIPLEPLTRAPEPGESPFGAGQESRRATISPDGRWGFISHGGDGRISVIDTSDRRVARTLTVPTPLEKGGYLVAVQPGMPLADTIGR
jgi:hypothetical protein